MRKHRGKLVKKAMEKYSVSEKCIYDYLRKFWQGGRTKDALSDNYDNCGRSKCRKYTKKVGRRSIAEKEISSIYKGKIIEDEDKKNFEKGITRYYKHNEKMTLAKTFENIKADSYKGKQWFEKPTLDQFYYWYHEHINKDEMEYGRKGKKNYQNNVRGLTSDSIYESFYPGFRYQVDSTIFPIFLVNRINRSLSVGRPTVYFSVDVFSSKVVGINVDLYGESWEGYAILLYNTFQGLEKYCRRFGIKMLNEGMNESGSPAVIMGDRGGFINRASDMLVKNLGVSIEYAPSYLGSAKGTVEKKFDIIENMIRTELPGIIETKYRERGQKDYRKYAKMDIIEFTQIVIEAVLERNAKIMKGFPLEKEAVLDETSPSANEIWNWGMKNKTGVLTNQPEDKLRYYLLRHAKASITEKGIKFKNMLYSCDLAEKENWFSRLNKSKPVYIAYDPRCLNTIMLYDKLTKKYIECEINRKMTSNDVYIDRTIKEIEDYDNSVHNKQQTVYLDKNDELFATKREEMSVIVEEANKKSEGSKIKVEDIEDNRRVEKASYGEKQSLTKNPYLEEESFEENVNVHRDIENDNDANVLNTTRSYKTSCADYIRKKVINDN
jgi:hypothetical protein